MLYTDSDLDTPGPSGVPTARLKRYKFNVMRWIESQALRGKVRSGFLQNFTQTDRGTVARSVQAAVNELVAGLDALPPAVRLRLGGPTVVLYFPRGATHVYYVDGNHRQAMWRLHPGLRVHVLPGDSATPLRATIIAASGRTGRLRLKFDAAIPGGNGTATIQPIKPKPWFLDKVD